MSSCHSDPVRNLCASTRATEHNMRCSSASFDISSENTATVFPSSIETFSAMFMANDVLPIDGRRRDDDQVRLLQPAGLLIQIGIVRFKPGDPAAALQQGINRAEGLSDDLLHAHEAAANALFRELRKSALRCR